MPDTMKYSHPLHFHKFVMELNERKWDGGSAEYGFWGVCCSRGPTCAKSTRGGGAPMRRRLSLAWVTPSTHACYSIKSCERGFPSGV